MPLILVLGVPCPAKIIKPQVLHACAISWALSPLCPSRVDNSIIGKFSVIMTVDGCDYKLCFNDNEGILIDVRRVYILLESQEVWSWTRPA